MVDNLVVRARGLECGGREFDSQGWHLKPETKLLGGMGVMVKVKIIASNLVISDCASDPHYKNRNNNK